jgi:hypothetical protein
VPDEDGSDTDSAKDPQRLVKQLQLLVAELSIGLTRFADGGTLVLLMNVHSGISFEFFNLIAQLNRIAQVSIFKPNHWHNRRTSCYLITKDVQTNFERG